MESLSQVISWNVCLVSTFFMKWLWNGNSLYHQQLSPKATSTKLQTTNRAGAAERCRAQCELNHLSSIASLTKELQTASGINISTSTVQQELYELGFHGWAAVHKCWALTEMKQTTPPLKSWRSTKVFFGMMKPCWQSDGCHTKTIIYPNEHFCDELKHSLCSISKVLLWLNQHRQYYKIL